MKPQCLTAAQCLKELARVMERFGIDNILDVVNSKYVNYRCPWDIRAVPNFNVPSDWSFAIAEVEGKPVFVGDELYDENGNRYPIQTVSTSNGVLYLNGWNIKKWSFNPPKPKTIMVPLSFMDTELISHGKWPSTTAIAACRQALEREGVKS